MITKEEFIEWKNNRTTKKIVAAIGTKVRDERITLATNAGRDQNYDRYRSGVLNGMQIAWDLDSLFDFGDEEDASNEGTQAPSKARRSRSAT